jgi:hypothetical protein
LKNIFGGYILKDNNDDTNSITGIYNEIGYEFFMFAFRYRFEYCYYTEKYEYENFLFNKLIPNFYIANHPVKKNKLNLDSTYEKDIINSFIIDYSLNNITISSTFEINNSNIKFEKYRGIGIGLDYNTDFRKLFLEFSANTDYLKYCETDKKEFSLEVKMELTYNISEKFYVNMSMGYERDNSNEEHDSYTNYTSSLSIGIIL